MFESIYFKIQTLFLADMKNNNANKPLIIFLYFHALDDSSLPKDGSLN